MINFQQFAMNMIMQNSKLANNPAAREMISAIQNGDSAKGEEIANNICQSYGITKDQAINQARQFFHV